MTDYSELVKALRCNQGNGLCPYADCEYKSKNAPICMPTRLTNDAAAAIEALEAEVKRLEPKRGEWIVHTEVKNIYGGICVECPVCGDHFVVLNVSDEKYCRSCGAKMMEVQE